MTGIVDDEGLASSEYEKAERYNASLEEFEIASASGEMTEEKIQGMDMTPQVKERLINTMKRVQGLQQEQVQIGSGPVFEGIQQEEVFGGIDTNQDTAQVSATAASAQPYVGGSFFDQEYEYDPEFFNPSSVAVQLPKSEEKKTQLGTMTAVVMESMGEPADGIVEQVVTEQDYGSSQTVSLIVDQITQDPKEEFWNNTTSLLKAAANPIEASRQLAAKVVDYNLQPPEAKLFEATMRSLTPDAQKAFLDFSFITKEWQAKSYLDDILTAQQNIQMDRINLAEFLATIFNPAQSITSRVDGGRLLETIRNGLDIEGSSGAILKANAGDDVYNYLYDRNLSTDEFITRLEALGAFIKESDELASTEFGLENINPVWAMEYLSIIQGEIRAKGSGKTFGAFIDTLDAVDAATWADVLYRLGRIAVLKAVRPALMAKPQGSWSAADIDAVNKLFREASGVQGEMPSQGFRFYEPSGGIPRLNQDSLADALIPVNPEVVGKTIREASTPQEGAKLLGMKPEDLEARLMGDMTGQPALHPAQLTGQTSNVSKSKYELMHDKFVAELNNTNLSDVMTKEEIARSSDTYAKIVMDESRGTLFPSGTRIASLNDDGSIQVGVTFGKNKEGGYESLQEAEAAGKFLFGTEYQIKPQGNKFFLEVNTNINPDRRYVDQFNDTIFAPSDVFTSSLLPLSGKMNRELFDVYNNLTDRANRLSGLIVEPLRALGKLSTEKQKNQWISALVKGDADGVEYGSKAALEAAMGEKVSSNVWNAYEATRMYYRSVAEVRQKRAYNNLAADGYRGINLNGNPLQDMDGRVYGRPLVDKPKASSLESPAPTVQTGTTVKQILDLRSGLTPNQTGPLRVLDNTDEAIEGVYQGDAVIVRLNRPLETASGDFQHVVIRLDDIRDLPSNPMNIRPGHIDRNYAAHGAAINPTNAGGKAATKAKGGNQYVVQVKDTRTVDGVEVGFSRTVAIVGDTKQWDEMVDKLAKGISDKEGISYAEARARFSEQPVPSRERAGELELDEGRTLSNMPAHARHRGEQIKGYGYDGFAEIADVVSALNKSQNEVRGLLGTDVVETMRTRFAKKYANLTDNWNGFPTRFEAIVWKQTTDKPARDEAERWFKAIQTQDRLLNGRKYKNFLDNMEIWAKSVNERMPVRAGLVEAATKIGNYSLEKALQLTTTFIIAARLNYQLPANVLQGLGMLARNPKTFAQGFVRSKVAAIALAYPDKFTPDALAKIFGSMSLDFGMTGAQFQKYLKNLKESGAFNINIADDILHVMSAGAKVEAGRFYLRGAKFWGNLVNPIEWLNAGGRVLSIPAKAGITYNNFLAWNYSFSEVAAKNGIEYALSRLGQRDTQALMGRLTFTQNRSDQFAYQQNTISQVFMQFMQHPQKMFLGTYVDPLARAVTGGKLGFLKKGTNPYADTWAQAMMTTLGMTGLVGAGSMATGVFWWDEAKDDVSDFAKEYIPEEAREVFLYGLVGSAVNNMVGEEVNFAERFSAANVLQSSLSMMFTNENDLILGGPAAQLGKTFKELYRLGRAYYVSEDMTKDEALDMLNNIAVHSLTGYSDAFKAWYAYSMGKYITKDGVNLGDAAPNAWIAQALSLSPEKVLNYYKTRDAIADAKANMKTAVDAAIRHSQYTLLTYGKNTEQLQPDDIINAALAGLRNLELVYSGMPDMMQEAKAQFMERNLSDPSSIILRNAELLVKIMSPKDAVKNLERIRDLKPEFSDYIQMMIDSLKQEYTDNE